MCVFCSLVKLVEGLLPQFQQKNDSGATLKGKNRNFAILFLFASKFIKSNVLCWMHGQSYCYFAALHTREVEKVHIVQWLVVLWHLLYTYRKLFRFFLLKMKTCSP